jgi:hypothetical protein
MSTNRRGRKRSRVPAAAAGSAAQETEMVNTDPTPSPEMSDAEPSFPPRLIEDITERVLGALQQDSRNDGRSRRHKSKYTKRTNSQTKRARRSSPSSSDSPGTEGSSSDESTDSSSSSDESSSSSDVSSTSSDEGGELLSSPISCQIDVKIKNKIWQNRYVDLSKLLPKEDSASDSSLHLQSSGKSEYKFVASKPKKIN